MARHRSGDTPSDDRGRTFWGRTRDRLTGDGEDHGAPHEVDGRRADRRARRTQTVRTGLFGRVTTDRERKARDLRDRWSR